VRIMVDNGCDHFGIGFGYQKVCAHWGRDNIAIIKSGGHFDHNLLILISRDCLITIANIEVKILF